MSSSRLGLPSTGCPDGSYLCKSPSSPTSHPLQVLMPNDGLALRSGHDGDDCRRDSIERDEKRLAELGRRTIEMFVISHFFNDQLKVRSAVPALGVAG